MRSIVHVLGPAFLAGAFFLGCSDSASDVRAGDPPGGDPVTPTPDAGTPDATDTTITVNVTRLGQPAKDVVVVFNDADGTILETVKTDANGQAVSSGAVPAQASLLLGGGGLTRIVTYTALVAGDVIHHSDDNLTSDAGVGTYELTFPEHTDATTFATAVGGCRTTWTKGEGMRTNLTLYPACVQASNTVIGTAFDNDGVAIGFSFLEGNAVPGEGNTTSIEMGAWQQPGTLNLTIAGLPDAQTAHIDPLAVFGEQAGRTSYRFRVEGSSPRDLTIPTVSGAGAHQLLLTLSPMSDSYPAHFETIVSRVAATTRETSIDVGAVAKPVSEIKLDTFDARRVKLTLSGSPSEAEAKGLTALVYFSDDRGLHAWEFVMPPGTSSVVAPTLPESGAEGWLPLPGTDDESTDAPTYAVDSVQSSIFADYRAFVRELGRMTTSTPAEGSRWHSAVLPTDGTLSFTSTYQATGTAD